MALPKSKCDEMNCGYKFIGRLPVAVGCVESLNACVPTAVNGRD